MLLSHSQAWTCIWCLLHSLAKHMTMLNVTPIIKDCSIAGQRWRAMCMLTSDSIAARIGVCQVTGLNVIYLHRERWSINAGWGPSDLWQLYS